MTNSLHEEPFSGLVRKTLTSFYQTGLTLETVPGTLPRQTDYHIPSCVFRSRFWGRGCDEALFSEEKKGFSVKSGEAIQ